MKIAVIGAGAIGSVVAGRLKKSGADVVLIGRDDQVKAIKKNGLTIKGPGWEEIIENLPVATELDDTCALAIFATKTQDLEAAYQQNNLFLDEALILTTQNGVQADNILSSHFDHGKIYSSIVMFGSTYTKAGEVTYNFDGDWIIGKPFTPIDPKTHEIAEVLGKAFKVEVANNIVGMKWLKLFVNFNNCIPALLGKSMQETFADLDFCRLSILLLKEGVDIITKANIKLVSMPQFSVDRIYGLAKMPLEQAAGIINKTLTSLSKEPLYGSILQSILRKRTSEIDFINGEVVFIAKQMQQVARMNERIVDMVHHVERTGNFYRPEQIKEIFELNMIQK